MSPSIHDAQFSDVPHTQPTAPTPPASASDEATGDALNADVTRRGSSRNSSVELPAAILSGASTPATSEIYPPVPAYSPPSASVLPLFQPYISPSVDAELLRYTLAHDHGEAPVTQRLPEAYPTDDRSFRSSQRPSTLPAYGENEPPRYTRWVGNAKDEPQTLAMWFFKFGFFFPAFWIFGALMLVTPLRSPDPFSPRAQESAWPPHTEFIAWAHANLHTEEDRIEFMRQMQEVEMKWARRCLSALGILAGLCITLGVMIFGVMKVA